MLDFILPKLCVLCENTVKESKICQFCELGFQYINNSGICKTCGAPLEINNPKDNINCGTCMEHAFYFNSARSLFLYNGNLRKLLHLFKYDNLYYLGSVLADYMYGYFKDYIADTELILPVPIHINKLRVRGYNQSAVICKEFSKRSGLRCDLFVLKKLVDTRPQVEIRSFAERAKNVKNAYILVNQQKVINKNLLLIDDVFTSGSTVSECCKLLVKSGVKSVKVLTVARSVYHHSFDISPAIH